jgi:3-isopropylmalate dehydrogenase
MMFKYSFNLEVINTLLEVVVNDILEEGYRTKDIMSKGGNEIGCAAMGDRVAEELEKQLG